MSVEVKLQVHHYANTINCQTHGFYSTNAHCWANVRNKYPECLHSPAFALLQLACMGSWGRLHLSVSCNVQGTNSPTNTDNLDLPLMVSTQLEFCCKKKESHGIAKQTDLNHFHTHTHSRSHKATETVIQGFFSAWNVSSDVINCTRLLQGQVPKRSKTTQAPNSLEKNCLRYLSNEKPSWKSWISSSRTWSKWLEAVISFLVLLLWVNQWIAGYSGKHWLIVA